MPFSTVFQFYCGSQCTYPCFPGVPLTSNSHNILSKPLAFVAIVEEVDSGERSINPVASTVINPWKEY